MKTEIWLPEKGRHLGLTFCAFYHSRPTVSGALSPHLTERETTAEKEKKLAVAFGLLRPINDLKHDTKPLCDIQGKLGHQSLKPLGFGRREKEQA